MPALPKRNPARRNKSATKATLSAVHDLDVPPLPDPDDGQSWGSMTIAWWSDVWRSPMAPEYDSSDIHGLYLLAVLINSFWREPSKDLAAEIRLQRQCFGLTPIDRRRLQWEIERTDEAQDKGRRRRTGAPASKQPTRKSDPRSVLAAVP